MSNRLLFFVLLIVLIIAIIFYNSLTKRRNRMNGGVEGFDCASESPLTKESIDTSSTISSYFGLFVNFVNDRCSSDLTGYDLCSASDDIKIDINMKNTIPTNNDKIKNDIGALSKIYDTVKTMADNSENPFYSVSVVNIPKPCGCYKQIMINFEHHYKIQLKYTSTNLNTYYSVIRYFFDVENPTDKIVYTGLGNYPGVYTTNYYDKFIVDGNYNPPNEITSETETVNLLNPSYNYYLNYYGQYLLMNSREIKKPMILSFIFNIAAILRTQYTGIYDIEINPFPGKLTTQTAAIPAIIEKIRYKTFTDYDKNGKCSGTTLSKHAVDILNNLTDRKYFVAYLKAVIYAINNQNEALLANVDKNTNWDPIGAIIKHTDLDSTMLLSDRYLFGTNPKHMFDLMEYFGHFDKHENKYILNNNGLIVVKQMSIDDSKCVIDYLERMSVLAFTPVKYGSVVNYDRWMFYS